MKIKLSDISKIISGFSFRGAIPYDSSSNLHAVQVKDIDEYGQINYSTLSSISEDDIRSNAFLQHNDIVLSSRGTESSAIKVALHTDKDQKTIATSSLYILRVTDNTIEPEYLLYYLKSFYGQRALKSIMTGATVQSIPKKELAPLLIHLPSKKQQALIIDTMQNITKQKKLLTKKINLLNALSDNIVSTHI